MFYGFFNCIILKTMTVEGLESNTALKLTIYCLLNILKIIEGIVDKGRWISVILHILGMKFASTCWNLRKHRHLNTNISFNYICFQVYEKYFTYSKYSSKNNSKSSSSLIVLRPNGFSPLILNKLLLKFATTKNIQLFQSIFHDKK